MLGHLQVAGFKLEFVQSPPHKTANDFVGKFIARYGEGMHHISIDLKDFDATCERLKRDGVRVVDERTQLARRAPILHLAAVGLRRADPNLGRPASTAGNVESKWTDRGDERESPLTLRLYRRVEPRKRVLEAMRRAVRNLRVGHPTTKPPSG